MVSEFLNWVSLVPFNLQWGAVMKNDEEPFAENETGEEEIIDFEFDDLADDAGPAELADVEEEEIIELIEVVEGGEEPGVANSETAEIERLLDEEDSLEEEEIEVFSEEMAAKETGTDEELELGVTEPDEEEDFELLESEETGAGSEEEAMKSLEQETEDLTLDLDSALETIEPLEEEISAEASLEPDLTQTGEEEKVSDLEELTPLDEKEDATSEEGAAEELSVKLPSEDLSAISEASPEPLKREEDVGTSIAAPTGISEERLEEMMVRAVREVIEDKLETLVARVARETMTDVAERLITEAIEALKQSLASDSE